MTPGASVSVGSGGLATLYSGGITGSTGLDGLVGTGSGRFRYGSNALAHNYTLALTAGLNAIYRERPTITRSIDNQTVVYGATPTFTFSVAGTRNGDTDAQAFATASTVTVGGAKSTAGADIVGTHSLTGSGGLASQLGYAVNAAITPGTLTVTPRILTANYTASNKTYDGTTAATAAVGSDNRLANDQLAITIGGASFADANAGTGKAVAIAGATLSGTDAGNYTLAATGASTATITPVSPPSTKMK